MSVTNGKNSDRLVSKATLITQVVKILTTSMELPQLLEAVLESLKRIPLAEKGIIMLWDEPAGGFCPVAEVGYGGNIKKLHLHTGEGIVGKVFDWGKASLLNSPDEIIQQMNTLRPMNRNILRQAVGDACVPRNTLAVPITCGTQKFGVLVLETYENFQPFDEADLLFIETLANLIALALDRARLSTLTRTVQTPQTGGIRSESVATLSHQLRIPLSAIKGYSTALLMDEIEWEETKRREFLQRIDEACDSMETLITDLLDSSLFDLNQLVLARQPLRLQQISREVVTEMQHRMEIHRPIIDFPADFPVTEADPRWIRQVFRNLLDNAIKYSPEGGLVVIKGEVRPGDVVVSIADQGLGISPEDLIPLFEKFYRVKTPNGYTIPGTGLGLPIARAIVEAHGGRIWAESQPGQGTTLYFSLPLHRHMETSR